MDSQPHPIHPLQHRLAELRREVRRLVTIQGLAVVIASLLAVLMSLGGIDYIVRFQDRGVLALFSLAILATLIFTAYRFLFIPSRHSWNDTALALRIQERLPVLSDRLASAVEFLRQDEADPLAGSVDLRRAVISQTTAACERIDFKQILDVRPARRWAFVATAMGVLAALLVAANPAASGIAMQRLAAPLGSVVWPRTSHLALRGTIRPIGRGQAFVVEVVDDRGARLPDEVKIWYRPRTATGKSREDVERMTLVGNMATARREQVSKTFQFRIVGGDSEPIDWTTVPVLDPPEIAALRIHRTPPAYARLAASDDDSPLSMTVLAGTRLSLSATASKPLVAAWLLRDGQPELPVALAEATKVNASSKSLRVDMVADKSTTIAFKLLDGDNLTGGNGQRWELHVVADAPPKAVIDLPAGNISVTSSAVVPVQITSSDDFALQQVDLTATAQIGKDKASSNQVLYSADGRATANLEPSRPHLEEKKVLKSQFDIAEFVPRIEAGMQVKLVANATDFLPQTGSSEPRTLTIITKHDLLEGMSARQNLLLSELARLLKIQREAREQIRIEQIRLNEMHSLAQAEVDRLQVCELTERDVARSLSRKGDGATAQIVTLLADLEMNRVEKPDFKKRLQEMLAEMDRLEREHLPPLAQALTAAVKSAQLALDPDAAAARDRSMEVHRIDESLATTLSHQQAVIDSLTAMLDSLRLWDDYQRFYRDLSRLARDQDEVARNTAQTGRDTLTKELKDLTPAEFADLKVLAERQAELARKLDRLEEEMGRTSDTLRSRDPKSADALSDAQAESRKANIAATMRSTADELQANRIGQVVESQTAVAENLRSLLDVLSNDGGKSPAGRAMKQAEKMARLEDEVKHLHAQEQRALKDTREFDRSRHGGPLRTAQSAKLHDLAERQADVRDELGRTTQTTEPGGAFRLALSVAGDDLNLAAAALAQNDTGTTAQSPQQSAINRLAQILEALKPEEPERKPDDKNDNKQPKKSQTSDDQPTLAELKLVKALQEDINHRTKALGEAVSDHKVGDAEAQSQFDRLSKEQGQLAALATKFLAPQKANPAPAANEPSSDPTGGETP